MTRSDHARATGEYLQPGGWTATSILWWVGSLISISALAILQVYIN